jgi:aminoglycoside 6'-N-acetyltransferase
MSRIRGALTELRRASQADADLLARWHADPEVSRYWDSEVYSPEEIRGRLARPDVDAHVIEVAGEPVGYLQAWTAEGTGGLDMFLIPSARGRGYGPDAARALAERLLETGWTRVTTDPYTWNEAAIRAWRRAGFEPVEERPPDEDHTAAWLLMEWRG